MRSGDGCLARCVGDIEAFRSSYWGQRALHRSSGSGFADLLDVEDVERLLSLLARRPTFRVVRDGPTISVSSYTSTVRVGGAEVHEVADLDQIVELVAEGATIVLQGLQRTWLPLARLCDSLQESISHPVQANAYLSPPGAAALRRHADHHDVIALQTAGTKAWNVDGLGDLVMEPGDVLYLPAGTEHEAHAHDEHSLHVAIGVLTVRWRDVVRRLQPAATEGLDIPLPLGFAKSDAATAFSDGLTTALGAMVKHLTKVDPAAVQLREAERTEQHRRHIPGDRLRAAVDPYSIDDTTRLRREVAATLTADGGERASLKFSGRTLSLPESTTPALLVVLDRAEFTVAELNGLDGPSRAVLARRLVREGVLSVIR